MVIQVQDLVLELPLQRAVLGGRPLRLTPCEFKLLWHVFQYRGEILSHGWLLLNIWGYPPNRMESRTVAAHVCRLRAKLGNYAGLVETVWEEGYRYNWEHYGPPLFR